MSRKTAFEALARATGKPVVYYTERRPKQLTIDDFAAAERRRDALEALKNGVEIGATLPKTKSPRPPKASPRQLALLPPLPTPELPELMSEKDFDTALREAQAAGRTSFTLASLASALQSSECTTPTVRALRAGVI